MKPGLVPGVAVEFSIVVTPDMAPHFDAQMVHPVYSTWTLVHHLELAGRRVLTPFLEEHEEGVGGGISIQHRAPALIGARVSINATCASFEQGRLVCRVAARTQTREIAVGEFLQVIMPRKKLDTLLRRAAEEIEDRSSFPPKFFDLLPPL